MNGVIQILLKMKLWSMIVFDKVIILVQIKTGTRLPCKLGPKFGHICVFLLNTKAQAKFLSKSTQIVHAHPEDSLNCGKKVEAVSNQGGVEGGQTHG